ncbi:helix-turn-helix domain-containing protein [Mucilaginibacter celer]|uniref:Helix-turn-helix domain-containing protein n=1 Tax=Mucilaginibacter celer TaxID=2305508 RepID=A0A494VJQ0_9SPHI|nr:helix-turn-helix transcriptional regulator [Mucilaginibacter celer]AYL95297.1 helix-turn-helix domain-containing protein [Mucilaginibacter celer]
MKEKEEHILKTLGEIVLRIRTDKSLSQQEVSNRCDVDRAKISKIESGSANYNITTLIELAKGLGVSPKDLLDF